MSTTDLTSRTLRNSGKCLLEERPDGHLTAQLGVVRQPWVAGSYMPLEPTRRPSSRGPKSPYYYWFLASLCRGTGSLHDCSLEGLTPGAVVGPARIPDHSSISDCRPGCNLLCAKLQP